MKEKDVFFNPFRLISPKLNAEASRLADMSLAASAEVTCLEEGLLVMISKLHQMADLAYKNILLPDKDKIAHAMALGEQIHEEEKNLTNAIVCRPTTTADVLKAVVLFPGKLERSGDLLESVVNCAKIKARDGILFSDKALAEVERLFGALSSVIENFRDLLSTLNPTLLGIVTKGCNDVIQMTLDFAVSHEDRLIEGLCSPKASSLYLDVLDSVRGVSRRILEMNESLEKIAATYQTH